MLYWSLAGQAYKSTATGHKKMYLDVMYINPFKQLMETIFMTIYVYTFFNKNIQGDFPCI